MSEFEGYSRDNLPPKLWEAWEKFVKLDKKINNNEITYAQAIDELDALTVTDQLGRQWRIDPDGEDFGFWRVTDNHGQEIRHITVDDYAETEEDWDTGDDTGFDGHLDGGEYPDDHVRRGDAQFVESQRELNSETEQTDEEEDDENKPIIRIPKNLDSWKSFDKTEKTRFLGLIGAVLLIIIVLFVGVKACSSGSDSEGTTENKPSNSNSMPLGQDNIPNTDEGPDANRVAEFVTVLGTGDANSLRNFFSSEISDSSVNAAAIVSSSLSSGGYQFLDRSEKHEASPSVVAVVDSSGNQIASANIGWVQQNGEWLVSNVPHYKGDPNGTASRGQAITSEAPKPTSTTKAPEKKPTTKKPAPKPAARP